jgi:hypothetical protein
MNPVYTVFDCNLITLPIVHSNRKGNITAVENSRELPFDVKRIYYIYDLIAGASRGAHGHKQLEQIIIAASGSFEVSVDDGVDQKVVALNRPYYGLHLRAGMWRDIFNFSHGSICLVLASREYEPKDYIRDHEGFILYRRALGMAGLVQ